MPYSSSERSALHISYRTLVPVPYSSSERSALHFSYRILVPVTYSSSERSALHFSHYILVPVPYSSLERFDLKEDDSASFGQVSERKAICRAPRAWEIGMEVVWPLHSYGLYIVMASV